MRYISRRGRLSRGGALTAALCIFAQGVPAFAQTQTYNFDIPAEDLGSALRALARASRQQITFDSGAIRGKRSPSLKGNYSVRAALDLLLAGSGLTAESGKSGVLIVRPGKRQTNQSDPSVNASSPVTSQMASDDDIIVTAQKRSQSINDVGLTITALGAETLKREGIKSLDDLARSVPGLTYAATDYGTPVFTLRGVGFYDYSLAGYPTTSVYVDEVPLPFPVLTTHANLDLERVEVLKGPQGTLFGQNSTGGAINYVAAKPTNMFAAGVDVTLGRFGAGEASGFVSGPITDTLGVRIAGQYDYGSPWQRSFTRDDSLGRRNVVNGRLLLDWKPAPGVKIGLNLNAWRDTSDPQAGQYFATFPQTPTPDGSAIDPVLRTYPFAPNDPRAADWAPYHRPSANKRQYQAALRADVNLTDDIVITSISAYVDYHTRQTLDMDGTTVQDFDQQNFGFIKSFTQELRVAGGEKTPFRWVVGANYEHSKTFEQDNYLYGESTVANTYITIQNGASSDQRMRTYALFANGEYDIVPKLTLKLGGRYTNAKRKANMCTFDLGDGNSNTFVTGFARFLSPGVDIPDLQMGQCITLDLNNLPARFLDTLKEDNFSWRAGLDYKASRDLLLYANVSKGYKAGSYPIVGAFNFSSYFPVVQESLLDYEAGFKAKAFDRKIGLNGAVFYYDYRNKQLLTKVIDAVVGVVPALANIPKSRVKGAELELTATPTTGLRFSGSITYLDAKITRYVGVNAGGIAADFAGTQIPFTPKWQYAISADYNFPIGDTVQPYIGASLTGRAQSISIVGGASGAQPQNGYRSKIALADTYDVPGYALLDLRAGIEARDGSWRLMVWGKNVTNKYYWQNVVTSYDVVTRYAGRPATYGITFGYNFGG
jgi:outer membrane receptor protein involved in Fe transport